MQAGLGNSGLKGEWSEQGSRLNTQEALPASRGGETEGWMEAWPEDIGLVTVGSGLELGIKDK